jgi:hypothetical protein
MVWVGEAEEGFGLEVVGEEVVVLVSTQAWAGF